MVQKNTKTQASAPISPRIDQVARLVLAAAALALVALLAYVLYYFSGLSQNLRLGGLVGTILGLALIGAAFKKTAEFRASLALALCTLGTGVYVIEAAVVLVLIPLEDRQTNQRADPRHAIEVYQDLIQKDPTTTLQALPGMFIAEKPAHAALDGHPVIPLIGRSHSTTILGNESGHWAIYKSDEHGFNNPAGLHKSGRVPIAVIGDSFTHGHSVNPGEDYVSLLRNKFPGTLNLGIGGAGTLTRLAALREYAEPLRPRVVLWVHTERTLRRIADEADLLPYLDPKYRRSLARRQPEIDQIVTRYLATKTESATRPEKNQRPQIVLHLMAYYSRRYFSTQLEKQLARLRYQAVDERSHVEASHLETFEKALATARKSVASWGGKLVFVYLATPEWNPSHPRNEKSPVPLDRDAVMKVVHDLGIESFDTTESLQTAAAQTNFYSTDNPTGHFGPEGYRIFADLLIDYLKPHF